MTEATRVSVARDLRNLIVLFFGGPFLGWALSTVSFFLSGWLKTGLITLGGYILISYVQRTKRVGVTKAAFIMLRWYAVLAILGFAIRGVALLASTGAYGHGRSTHMYVLVQLCVSESIAWLIVGIPSRAFSIRLDLDGQGYARAVLLGVLVWAAAALTGANILMLHFLGGPLRSINTAALTVGVIFAVVFVVPIYRFAAASCWKYGVAGMFSTDRMIERWRKMLAELQAASDSGTKLGRESGPTLESVNPRPDKGAGLAAAGSAVGDSVLRPASTVGVTKTRHTSSAVSGRAARRARKKARKAGGTARS